MRKLVVLTTLLVGLTVLVPGVFPGVKPGLTAEKTYKMSDSLELHVWISRAMTKDPAPLLVLLPMRARDHRSYDSLRASVMNRVVGFSKDKIAWPYIAAFDLRGHGRSKERGEAEVDVRDMPDEEYLKMPSDVATALKAILADSSYRIDSSSILVAGASIGANTAIMLTEHFPGIKKVALLSPGQDYHSLKPDSALAAFEGDILIMSSIEDRYSHASSRILAAQNEKRCRLEEFYGNKHGTDIINSYPEAMEMLVDWLFGKAD